MAEIGNIKKTVDGMVYNTQTAELIWMIANSPGPMHLDFSAELTGLYRTRRGRWFIAGISGAHGRWGYCDSYGQSHGRGLTPTTASEAREFLEAANGPVEDYFEVEAA